MEDKLNLGKMGGVYYRQGQLMYTPEDEVMYDDSYKTPLLDLLSRKPKTIIAVRSLLDEGGYIGRHKVVRAYKNGCYPLNDVRILINLIWSETTYVWPDQGVYSLDFHKILRSDKKYKLPEDIIKGLDTLYQYQSPSPYTLKMRGGLDLAEAVLITDALERMRIIKGERLYLVDDLEVKEVIGNLLTI
jgi:hypothetical protein